jgi:hypothetical protein
MAKRIDPLKAKEAKQKKIAAVGGVILLALLGVQGPKTLKMLKGPSAEPPAAAAPTPVPGGSTPTPAQTTTGTAEPAAVADLASVADSDVAPEAEEGQLATFERFSSKDPFVQQARPAGVPAAGEEGAEPDDDPSGAESPATAPDDDSSVGPDDGENGFTGGLTDEERGLGGSGSGSGGSSSDGSGPAPASPQPSQPTIAEATSIAVNGVAEDVAVDASFPAGEPTFVLVSLAKDGKSVQIGIAGGEYAGGGDTMTLTLGKKLVLQNTADGSRYELELRAVQGFPLPRKS